MLDSLLPHAHKLPSLELLEEWQLFDVVVGISFYQPLTQRDELDRRVVFIQGQTFSRECVVLLLVSLLIRTDKQVIRVSIRVWI